MTRLCGDGTKASGSIRYPRALCAGLLFASFAAYAQAPAAKAEIDGLIAALGDSDCRFERNGKWYAAAEARKHLQRKYDWLDKRGLATTPELFIERAASRSSISGQAYHVRCPGRAEQVSADWFQAQLRRLRAAPGSAKLAPSPPAPAR